MQEVIVVYFGELWLKGKNRPNFIKMLKDNVLDSISGLKYSRFVPLRDRFLIYIDGSSDTGSILEKLGYVFGISRFIKGVITDNSIDSVLKAAFKLCSNEIGPFKISAHRTDKSLEFTSKDIVSAFINQDSIEVSRDSDKILFINPTNIGTFEYLNKEVFKGLGGLPVGMSGKAVILLSGGIDSPVASYYAMKRGLVPIYLHVHAFNDNGKAENSKMGLILETLSKYYSRFRVYYVPAYIFQLSILDVKHSFEIILFKRMLYQMAKKIAKKEGAKVIVTGESLSQVSSQTVSNLISTSHDVNDLLVMRPLIGLDKQDIISKAKEIGTYDQSIIKYKDVCSMHSRDAVTTTRLSYIDELSNSVGMDDISDRSLLKADVLDYPIVKLKRSDRLP